jgi:hypothetical protein
MAALNAALCYLAEHHIRQFAQACETDGAQNARVCSHLRTASGRAALSLACAVVKRWRHRRGTRLNGGAEPMGGVCTSAGCQLRDTGVLARMRRHGPSQRWHTEHASRRAGGDSRERSPGTQGGAGLPQTRAQTVATSRRQACAVPVAMHGQAGGDCCCARGDCLAELPPLGYAVTVSPM